MTNNAHDPSAEEVVSGLWQHFFRVGETIETLPAARAAQVLETTCSESYDPEEEPVAQLIAALSLYIEIIEAIENANADTAIEDADIVSKELAFLEKLIDQTESGLSASFHEEVKEAFSLAHWLPASEKLS